MAGAVKKWGMATALPVLVIAHTAMAARTSAANVASGVTNYVMPEVADLAAARAEAPTDMMRQGN